MRRCLLLVSRGFARTALAACVALGLAAAAHAAPPPADGALPAEVEAALARARLPREALAVWVGEVDGAAAPRLSHRAAEPMNPASVMKLVTTFAALDLLGPAYTWRTPVYVDGSVRDGTLRGHLVLQGQGDPKLVVERLWLLLRRVQGLGIRRIEGDIVLDRSAFELPEQDPASFDGEPLRPYNAAPDALLVNYKSLLLTFVPDRASQSALLQVEPPLAGVQVPASVPLAPAGPDTVPGDCGDWRGALRADFSDPARLRFAGRYPAGCGERAWPLAYADPASYTARAVAGLWAQLGGSLQGQVREGRAPAGLRPVFELASPPLAEVVRDINKFSNNVMAQQLFLTLSLQQTGLGTPERSRELLARWWRARFGELEAPSLDNGSGLSRRERASARALARLLQAAWASPLMPELSASLPLAGVDGTLRRNRSQAQGAAHLKTGSLRDVVSVAGYVHAASGRRYVLVALVNHPQAQAARPALDALIEWTWNDQARPRD